MVATPHMVLGAAIGKAVRRPWLAWPLAFASHFLLDYIPHLDSHGLFGREQGGPTLPEAAVALADVAVGVVLVGWLVRRQPLGRVMVGGAFFAILIDLLDNMPLWGDAFTTWPGTAWLSAWHHMSESNVTPDQWLLGVGTQVTTVVIAMWFCRSLGRPRLPEEARKGRGLFGSPLEGA
jgi:hypothetical protein